MLFLPGPGPALFLGPREIPGVEEVAATSAPILVPQVQPLPWSSLAIIRQGDSTSAPAAVDTTTGALVVSEPQAPTLTSVIALMARAVPDGTAQVVITSPELVAGSAQTIVRQGDPTAAPVVTTTAAPVVVSPEIQTPARGLSILGSAGVDFYSSAPVVSTPIPQRPFFPTPLLIRQLQDGFVSTQPPLVSTPIPQRPFFPTSLLLRQLQDGGTVTPTNTATPPPFISEPLPQVPFSSTTILLRQLQDGTTVTPPLVVTALRVARWVYETIVSPASFEIGTAVPATVVTKTQTTLPKAFVSIQIGSPTAAPVIFPDVFGSLGPTKIVGVLRMTTVIGGPIRSTASYSPNRVSRVTGLLRSTITNALVRLTNGRIDMRSTSSRNNSRSSGVK